MTRTTIDLDPFVLSELRRRGAREHKSMGTVASELLAQAMATPEDLETVRPFRWIHRDLGTPKIDLEDKEALRRMSDEGSSHESSTAGASLPGKWMISHRWPSGSAK